MSDFHSSSVFDHGEMVRTVAHIVTDVYDYWSVEQRKIMDLGI